MKYATLKNQLLWVTYGGLLLNCFLRYSVDMHYIVLAADQLMQSVRTIWFEHLRIALGGQLFSCRTRKCRRILLPVYGVVGIRESAYKRIRIIYPESTLIPRKWLVQMCGWNEQNGGKNYVFVVATEVHATHESAKIRTTTSVISSLTLQQVRRPIILVLQQ